MNRILPACVLVAVALAIVAPCSAQTLKQRMDRVRDQQRDAEVAKARELQQSKTGQFLVSQVRTGGLMEVPAKQAFEFIAVASGVPIIVNWNALAVLGIDPDQPVTLVGPDLTGEMALDMIVTQLDVDGQLLWEPSSTFVRVMTKEQANKEQVVRTYPIGDLLMTVPNFTNAPSFDLVEVTRSPASSGGGAASSPFQDADDEEVTQSMEERGEQIATLIRETVEPDIWREAGGLGGSIRYWQQHLIVSAPPYVHRQILGEVHVPGTPKVRGVDIAPRPMVIADAGAGNKAGEAPNGAAASKAEAHAAPVRVPSGPAEAAVRDIRSEMLFVSTPIPTPTPAPANRKGD